MAAQTPNCCEVFRFSQLNHTGENYIQMHVIQTCFQMLITEMGFYFSHTTKNTEVGSYRLWFYGFVMSGLNSL